MTDRYRRYAAIIFDGSSNLQFNFEGMHQTILSQFEDTCTKRGAEWGRLLDWRTGELAAGYSKETGLQLSVDEVISGAPLADALEDYMSDHWQAKIGTALLAGIREIDFTPAQYVHLTKYLDELRVSFPLTGGAETLTGPGGMG